jgi:hypothetical protein
MLEPQEATALAVVTQPRNANSLDYHVEHVNESLQNTAEDVIESGRRLLQAEAELSKEDFKVLLTRIRIERTFAVKFKKIASSELLCAHAHKLPTSWMTLYELSQVDYHVLEEAIHDGTVHPNMQRKHAVALRPDRSKRKVTPKTPVEKDLEAARAHIAELEAARDSDRAIEIQNEGLKSEVEERWNPGSGRSGADTGAANCVHER